jgi:ATP-dependent Clp protease adaptor protein ClpS
MNGKEQYQLESDVLEDVMLDEIHTLWLINDDFNTFEFVIDTLMELCRHSYEQAMQCALITHNRGRCDILKGYYSELEIIATTMLGRGVTVEIRG